MKTLRAHVESSNVYNAFKHVFIFCWDSEERGLHKASIHIPANNYDKKRMLRILFLRYHAHKENCVDIIYTYKQFYCFITLHTYQIISENVQHLC